MYASSHSSSPPVSPRFRIRGNTLLTNGSSLVSRLSRCDSLTIYSTNRARPGSPLKRQQTTRRGLFLGPRSILTFIFWSARYIIPLCLLVLLGGFIVFEPHLELAFYSRKWVKQEVKKLEPLGWCFNPDRVSSRYNVSEYVYGPKNVEVQAGVPLKFGLDCYDFAGTIRSSSSSSSSPSSPVKTEEERTIFHTYWRLDLAPFGPRQEWMVKSFFATQDLDSTKLILWSNGDLGENEILRRYLKKYPKSFALRVVDIPMLATGTPLDGSGRLKMNDKKAWLDGDLLRLLLLWNYGGVWIDMDSLLTRDLEPLLEHEFVTQWDCYGMWLPQWLFQYVHINRIGQTNHI